MITEIAFEELCEFADVKTALDKAQTKEALAALNEAVEERFARDQQQLVMSDSDWIEYTGLLARRVSQLDCEETQLGVTEMS